MRTGIQGDHCIGGTLMVSLYRQPGGSAWSPRQASRVVTTTSAPAMQLGTLNSAAVPAMPSTSRCHHQQARPGAAGACVPAAQPSPKSLHHHHHPGDLNPHFLRLAVVLGIPCQRYNAMVALAETMASAARIPGLVPRQYAPAPAGYRPQQNGLLARTSSMARSSLSACCGTDPVAQHQPVRQQHCTAGGTAGAGAGSASLVAGGFCA